MSLVEAVNGSPEGHGTIRSTVPDRMSSHGTSPKGRRSGPSAIASPALTVSLVIPARNEARNIAWVLEQIPDTVTEVILVDGNSTDVTLTTARSYRPDIRVVPQEGVGKGSALRTGFLAATGDVIVMIDADGSMSPQEISHYLHFLANGYDFVKGSRFISGGGSLDITRIQGSRQQVPAKRVQFALRRSAHRPVLRILRVSPSLSRGPEAICDGIRDRGRDDRSCDAGGVADCGGAEPRAAAARRKFQPAGSAGRHSSSACGPSRPSHRDERSARAVDTCAPPRCACDFRARTSPFGMNGQTLGVASDVEQIQSTSRMLDIVL